MIRNTTSGANPHAAEVRANRALPIRYQTLLTSGHSRSGSGLSRKAVLNVHRCLGAALNDAVADHLLRTNPTAGASTYSKARERQEMLTWTVEEI